MQSLGFSCENVGNRKLLVTLCMVIENGLRSPLEKA